VDDVRLKTMHPFVKCENCSSQCKWIKQTFIL